MSERLQILLLTANPADRLRLDLDNEYRLLRNMMHDNAEAGNCELMVEWAARPTDLLIALTKYKPHIVHFAGHGNESGICLEDDRGMSRPLGKELLPLLFKPSLKNLRLVVLNACCSASQVEQLGRLVDFIVGTKAPIEDDAAVRFTAHFYQALAVGDTTREAFHKAQGKLAISGDKERAEQYELLVRAGADENKPLVPPPPPVEDYVTRVEFGDVTTVDDINIINVSNEGPGGFSSAAGPRVSKRRELDVKSKSVKTDGGINIIGEKNKYE
ncbi:MAG TPA: CHAT domain-containing protein [Pyrinomonadaceae bacterium]|nr:CHAT domain-containing protein [Pyrinomonadaceae bacterium]